MIKDFHMDPQYRKFMCNQQPSENACKEELEKTQPESSDMPVSENEGQLLIFIFKNIIIEWE